MIAYACDRCGEIIKEKPKYALSLYDESTGDGIRKIIHLCDSCADDFDSFMKEMEKTHIPEKFHEF